MNNHSIRLAAASLVAMTVALSAQATLISVSGPLSSAGTAAAIIAAPSDVLDDVATGSGMLGFDEAQGVITSVDHGIDGGVIAAGTKVNSHMIFLNSTGVAALTHAGVTPETRALRTGLDSKSVTRRGRARAGPRIHR